MHSKKINELLGGDEKVATENTTQDKADKKERKHVPFIIADEVDLDLTELGITLCGNPIVEWDYNGIAMSPDMVVTYIRDHRDRNQKRSLSKDNIANRLCYLEQEMRNDALTKFRGSIKYDPSAKDTFEELTTIICGDEPESQISTVLRHVIWTCKRRMFRLPTYCPIFVNVYGVAGSGKTEFLKAMFSIVPPPLKSYINNATELFNDDRHEFRFVENFVIIMDEISGLNRTDLNKLKNAIDRESVNYRLLGYNKSTTGRNNAQLIGTSNKRLRNTLMTDADIRKWAEVDIFSYPDDEVPDKMVKPLQAFDWLNLWRSVNENADSPFHDPDVYSQFKRWTENKCRYLSPTYLYLQDIIDKYEGQWISKRDLYDDGYCHAIKERQQGWSNFKETCEKLGFKEHRKNSGIGMNVPRVTMFSKLTAGVDEEDDE